MDLFQNFDFREKTYDPHGMDILNETDDMHTCHDIHSNASSDMLKDIYISCCLFWQKKMFSLT